MSESKADIAFKRLFSPDLIDYIRNVTLEQQNNGSYFPKDYDQEVIDNIIKELKKNYKKYNIDINDMLDIERSDVYKREFITFLDMGANKDVYENKWYEYDWFAPMMKQAYKKYETLMPYIYGDEFESVIGAPYGPLKKYVLNKFNEIKGLDDKEKKKLGGLYKATYDALLKTYPNIVRFNNTSDKRQFIDMLINKKITTDNEKNILTEDLYKDIKREKEEAERIEQENKEKEEALQSAQKDKEAAEEDKKAAEERTKEVKDDMTEKLASMSTKNKELRDIAAKVEPISEFFDKYAVSLAETVGRHDIKRVVDDAYKREMWKENKDDMIPKILKEYPTIETKEDAAKVADLIRGKKMNEVIERRKKMRAMDQIARLNPEELAIFDDNMKQQLINYQNEQLQELQQARNMRFMPPKQYIKYKTAVERHINPLLLRGNGRRI